MEFTYIFKPYSSFSIGDSVTFSHTFTVEDVMQFTKLIGDRNPLYFDDMKTTGTGKCRVPDTYLNSVCAKGGAAFAGTACINMGQTWQCPSPAFAGDTITYTATVTGLNDEKHELIIEDKGVNQEGAVVLTTRNTIRIMDKKKG